ncbi:OmpA family protein [Limnohabitans sp. B9-3]|uniref:OmpA family protein n=1 Tax=Limnohabitans sp. B9-3 TaxID=1100707 RepID=UPI00130424C3|nr:OmpA family protein [Limnohabitans sp. B9-3]
MPPLIRLRRWLVMGVLTFGAVFGAWAQQQQPGFERALGVGYTALKDLAPEQTRLVFYRPEGDGLGVITLHIDGRYHTSLQNGAFSALCLERASVNLQAQPGRSWARADPNREVSQNVVMVGGQTLYVRLSEALATRPRLDVVPAHIGAQEVQMTREQTHSVSRVSLAKPCLQVTAPALAFAPEVVTLSAQSAQNPAELAQLLKRLEGQYRGFKSLALHIVGHVTDMDSEASNEQLSKELAGEVQRYFAGHSTQFNPISVEGRGSKDRQTAPGQPARRVELGLTVWEP